MTIQEDTREKKKEVERIEQQFDALGVYHFRSKLPVGDYMNLDNPRLVIDRKHDLGELCTNVTQQHERFKRELLRAEEIGIKLIILCEHGEGIKSLEDVFFWKNPRRQQYKWVTVNGRPRRVKIDPKKMAISGEALYRTLNTIKDRYGVEFYFCTQEETGQRIVELLGVTNGEH